MAGMQTKLHLIANEPGTYKGFSASYSGHGFSDMKFNAIATADRQGFDEWVQKVKASPKTMDTMQAFDEVAKPSMNVPVTYFSSVKPKLYEDIIMKFGHEHHKGHAPVDANNEANHSMHMGNTAQAQESTGHSMHMSHNAHAGAEE